jgi:hypothetical protein
MPEIAIYVEGYSFWLDISRREVMLKEHSGSASPASTNSNSLETSFHLLVNLGPDTGLGVSLVPPDITLLIFLENIVVILIQMD